jgi:replicative DNA helicase
MGEYKLVKAFSSGKKNVYKLKTRTGRSIKASANHPFLKLNGWARLDQLKKGDRIGLSRQMGPKSPIKPFSDTEILFLAHLLGDGCILPRQPYHYTSADIDSIKVVSDAAEKLFGIASKVVRQSNWYHVYFPSPYRLARGKVHPITNWFNQMGIERARSYEKKVPNKVFECDSDQVSLFLRHLWSTDGNIRPKLLKGRKPSAAIYYASSSPVLSNQVQHLLLSIGIQSTITIHKSSKGYRDMYHVSVQGTPHQIRFLKNVGAIGQTAEHIPILLQQLEQIEPHYNFDVVPKEAWQTVIKEIKDKLNLTWRDVCANIQTSYCGSSLFKSGISRERMQRFYQIFKDDKMKELAESDVYWDEIISIEELGFEEVYDATVEDVHNFVANDIIVHNSIEQDADVVMFLLRREYYDPMDKPGMAELIIGKNRHGGIGNINLTYRKEISRFENHTPMKYVGSYQLASGPEFQN